ncbi:MAG TPA: trypsin-like serine protease [Pyrinomonadaceae bacterium]|nr:trypsin-like serine protease [Pyrinomonadaceae bacterium]
MLKSKKFFAAALAVLALVCSALLTSPGMADGGANHQKRNTHFGVSGGNVKDISRRFCCSGTLGSLVTNGSTQYILSNNHVLARADQAAVGEDVSQPGLIDNNCAVATLVADFTTAVPLGQNVDAALAQLRPGTMDSTGFIEDIGVPASTTVNPSVGLSVVKSGRTTGFTNGTISSINTSVSVRYPKSCGASGGTAVSYTNQVVINSTTFSAGGDSGSLILTSSGHNPVALLFAGSSSATIGNPINEVMSKLSARLGGGSLNFVGTGTAAPVTFDASSALQPYTPARGQMPELPEQAVLHASEVLDAHRDNLMNTPLVLGVGVGRSDDNDTDAAIIVYVDKTTGARPYLPKNLGGVKVIVQLTEPFVAF